MVIMDRLVLRVWRQILVLLNIALPWPERPTEPVKPRQVLTGETGLACAGPIPPILRTQGLANDAHAVLS
jgi:hypothetical protein